MDKRSLLAVVLCVAVLILYSSYMTRQQEQWKAGQDAVRPATTPEAAAPSPSAGPSGEAPAPAVGLAGAPRVPAIEAPCQEVVVSTPLYQAVFCSWNGRVMSWRLKHFRSTRPNKCPLLGWFDKPASRETPVQGAEDWVERIHAVGPGEFPLGLEFSTEQTRSALQEVLEPDRKRLDLVAGGGPDRLVFAGRDADGRGIQRVYTFDPASYLVQIEVRVQGIEPALQTAGLGLKLTERTPPGVKNDRYAFVGFMSLVDGSLTKVSKIKGDKDRYHTGDVAWEGFSDKYFLNCLIPLDNPRSSVVLDMPEAENGEPGGLWTSRLIYNVKDHSEGGAGRFSYSLYIGPKDLDILKAGGHSLQDAIDLGKFGFIAEPLLVVLKFFYRYTRNYGIAIILLTVLVKALLYPLTRKQFRSMRKMQKEMQRLKPKMEAVREKHKNDKEKLNRELMELYRTHQINPLSGCWPVLVQIPVFFALYNALLHSIELRQAPFFLWINDLSEKDPCYVTPIVLGLSQFLQQKMTPSTGDPAQQRIMMMMPLVFTFMFLYFPSGLVLYWLVNNIISIGQQYLSLRKKD